MDQRGVEGPAAQIVDEHVLALGGHGLAEPMGVLEPCRARLVEHRLHVEPGAPVGVHRDQPLRGGRVRRDTDRRLDLVLLAQAGVGMMEQLLADVGEKPGQ